MFKIRKDEKSICEASDIISDLPDPILCKILSFLPTKNVVGTCILSKRWNNLDPFGYAPICLDIDDSLYFRDTKNESLSNLAGIFVGFMDKLMYETLCGVPCLENMDLKCTKTLFKYINCDETIISWVSAALRYNIRKLALDVPMDDSWNLFKSLNGGKTLVSLKVEFWCCEYLVVPGKFYLPSLKQFEIRYFEGGMISEFIDGCPVLEKLEMHILHLNSIGEITIRCYLLKDLSITRHRINSLHTELDLHAPNLETLMLKNYVVVGDSFPTFSSLTRAHICVDADDVDSDIDIDVDDMEAEEYLDMFKDVPKIIAACSNTKELYLSKESLLHLRHGDLQLPQFQNLTLLTLDCVRFVEEWKMFAHLLVNAPNLKELSVNEGFYCFGKGYMNFIHSVPSLPTCLESHLQKIEFRVSRYNQEQINVIEYFLMNGKALEKLILRCCPSIYFLMVQRLITLPNQSKIRLEKT